MKGLIIYLLGGLIFSLISEYTVSDEMIELNFALGKAYEDIKQYEIFNIPGG